jgi:hypothetical protein
MQRAWEIMNAQSKGTDPWKMWILMPFVSNLLMSHLTHLFVLFLVSCHATILAKYAISHSFPFSVIL